MKVSVVIPVYNEAGTIAEVVARVHAVGLSAEVIIVDDASTDGTPEQLRQVGRAHPNTTILRHERNAGKGAALRTGFSSVTGDVVIIQDADLEVDPREFPKLLEPIQSGQAEVVYGSRFLGKSSRELFSLSYVANCLLTTLTNLVCRIHVTDMETCYKVFRRYLLDDITLKCNRFGFEPEFTVKLAKKGLRIHEIPINYQARAYTDGKKINWKDGVKAVFTILWFRVFD